MEQLELIDFSLEDDSLLPSTTSPENGNPGPFNAVLPVSPAVVNGKNRLCATVQETSISGSTERVGGIAPVTAAVTPTQMSSVPLSDSGAASTVKKMRSTKALNNLRKSLAWDKAFSTDEGVLDVDELPLVTKTPRTLVELHALDIPRSLVKSSSAFDPDKSSPHHGAGLVERVTPSPVPCSIASNCVKIDAAQGLMCETSSGVLVPGKPGYPDTRSTKSDAARPVLVNRLIKAAVQKVSGSPKAVPVNQMGKVDLRTGTQLRIPSMFIRKPGKSDESSIQVNPPKNGGVLPRCKSSSSLPSNSSARSSLSRKVSSVSKKVKDTLGKVLPVATKRIASVEGSGGDHCSSTSKTVQTPSKSLGHTFDYIGKVLKGPAPTSITRSRSVGGSLSGSSMGIAATISKPFVSGDMSNQEAAITDLSGAVKTRPDSKVPPRVKDEGVWGTTGGIAGAVPRKGNERPSFPSTKVSPLFLKKGPVAEADRAASKVSMEKLCPGNASQNNVPPSSGLRLPSPKIGFFDMGRAPPQQPTVLPERVFGGALESSSWQSSRHGLPPRPQQRLLSCLAGQPSTNNDLASARLGCSGIPSAPHLRPVSNKGTVASVSAPASPRSRDNDILSPATCQAGNGHVSSSKPGSASVNHRITANPKSHTSWMETAGPLRKLVIGSDGGSCDPSPRLEGRMTSDWASTRNETECKSSSCGREERSIKLADSAGVSYSNKSSVQAPELMTRGIDDCRLSSNSDDSLSSVCSGDGQAETVLCTDKVGSQMMNRSISLTSMDFNLGKVSNQLPCNKLESSQCLEVARAVGVALGNEIVDKLVVKVEVGFQENNLGTCENRQEMEGNNPSAPDLDVEENTNQPWQPCIGSSSKRSLVDGLSYPTTVTSKIEDVSKIKGIDKQELNMGCHSHYPGVCEEKLISPTYSPSERLVQEVNIISYRKPFTGLGSKIGNVLDSPSHFSDESLEEVSVLFSQAIPVMKECPSPLSGLEGLSHQRSVLAESEEWGTAENSVASTPPGLDLDCHSGKYPLGENRGCLNVIDQCSTTPPLGKDRNLVPGIAHIVSGKSGQENSRASEGQTAATYLRKPKQRKASTSQKLDQCEVCGALEVSFPFSEDRLRALEAAGQESLQKKSGAVQHSPPNKITPSLNPWSPVKRNGQQLGPFDCTKKSASASMAR